jgi:hypothetical protein
MKTIKTPDDIPNEHLKGLYHNWCALNNNALPNKKSVDQSLFGHCSPFCKLAILENDPFRVKYDVVGAAVQDLYNEPLNGRYLDELFDPWIRKQVIETYKTCVETKLPVYERRGISTVIGTIGYEYIILPFSDKDEDEVSAFVSCVFPLDMSISKFEEWQNAILETPWLD